MYIGRFFWERHQKNKPASVSKSSSKYTAEDDASDAGSEDAEDTSKEGTKNEGKEGKEEKEEGSVDDESGDDDPFS